MWFVIVLNVSYDFAFLSISSLKIVFLYRKYEIDIKYTWLTSKSYLFHMFFLTLQSHIFPPSWPHDHCSSQLSFMSSDLNSIDSGMIQFKSCRYLSSLFVEIKDKPLSKLSLSISPILLSQHDQACSRCENISSIDQTIRMSCQFFRILTALCRMLCLLCEYKSNPNVTPEDIK